MYNTTCSKWQSVQWRHNARSQYTALCKLPDHDMQAVVNEDALGTNVMLKAELHRVKVQLAAMHGQPPAMDTALATSLAFDAQPNTAAAQAAQVRNRLPAAAASAA